MILTKFNTRARILRPYTPVDPLATAANRTQYREEDPNRTATFIRQGDRSPGK